MIPEFPLHSTTIESVGIMWDPCPLYFIGVNLIFSRQYKKQIVAFADLPCLNNHSKTNKVVFFDFFYSYCNLTVVSVY